MTHAFELLLKVLTAKVPPRTLAVAVMNKLNCWLKTGNRQYEFERLYLENPDPFNYLNSAYERRKYDKTLYLIRKFRRRDESVLELGCSNGVFTRDLANNFGRVTAVDISQEVLSAAKEHNRDKANVGFLQADLRFLETGETYDVIICAEVLYYIKEADALATFGRLKNHLNANGIIVVVSGAEIFKPTFFYFDGWENVIGGELDLVFKEVFDDSRPYRILIFSPRNELEPC